MTNAAIGRGGRKASRGRGTALVEFVMIVPLIALILGLTFFFGWSMKNQQHVKVSDRYLAWRDVLTGQYDPNVLNPRFFGRQANHVGANRGTGPRNTLADLVESAGDESRAAGSLADELVLGRWPRGRSVRVGAAFPSDVGVWNRMGLTGPIRSHHVREGVEWRCANRVFNNEAVNGQFLESFDRSLPDNHRLAEVLRILYKYKWQYYRVPDDAE